MVYVGYPDVCSALSRFACLARFSVRDAFGRHFRLRRSAIDGVCLRTVCRVCLAVVIRDGLVGSCLPAGAHAGVHADGRRRGDRVALVVGVVCCPGRIGCQQRMELGEPQLALSDVVCGRGKQNDRVFLGAALGNDAVEQLFDGLSRELVVLLGRDIRDRCHRIRTIPPQAGKGTTLRSTDLGARKVALERIRDATREIVHIDVVARVSCIHYGEVDIGTR